MVREDARMLHVVGGGAPAAFSSLARHVPVALRDQRHLRSRVGGGRAAELRAIERAVREPLVVVERGARLLAIHVEPHQAAYVVRELHIRDHTRRISLAASSAQREHLSTFTNRLRRVMSCRRQPSSGGRGRGSAGRLHKGPRNNTHEKCW